MVVLDYDDEEEEKDNHQKGNDDDGEDEKQDEIEDDDNDDEEEEENHQREMLQSRGIGRDGCQELLSEKAAPGIFQHFNQIYLLQHFKLQQLLFQSFEHFSAKVMF